MHKYSELFPNLVIHCNNVELQFKMDEEGNSTEDGRMYAKTDKNGHGDGRRQHNDDKE